MKRTTKEPWFGPKKYLGWGWSIASWQGAVVVIILVALLAGDFTLFHRTLTGILGALAILVIFAFLAMLTADLPGGPKV